MAPKKPTTLHSYAVHIKKVCPELPSVSTLTRKLRSPERWFGRHKITFPLACTDGSTESGFETCQIFHELLPWNKLLWFVKMELKERSPGKLAVVRLPNAIVPGVNDEVHCAVVGLHWLLSQHRCVVSVEPHRRLLENYPQLFWDALKQSASVRCLALKNYEFNDESASLFLSAVSTNACLERIEWDHIEVLGHLARQPCLADWMASAASLKALRLTNIHGMSDAKVFTGALKDSPGLAELTVDAKLAADDLGNFYWSLSGSASLTELTIVGRGLQPDNNIVFLFHGLVANSVLRKLRFQQFCFELADCTLLSDMISANATLQELAFSSCHWPLCTHWPAQNETRVLCDNAKKRWGLWWRVDPFVHAIKNSASLRRLEFDENRFVDAEMGRLLAAVRENDLFEELCFRSLCRRSAIEFCNLVRDAGCTGKVAVDCCFSKCGPFVAPLGGTCELNSIRKHSFYDLCPERLQELGAVLKSSDNITALQLALSVGEVDEYCASFIADYLMSTSVLKEIDMNFDVTGKAVEIIVHGLSKNDSIEKISMRRWLDMDVSTICDWLERSTKVYHLEWLSFDEHPAVAAFLWRLSWGTQNRYRELLGELSQRLRNSYTLTHLCVEELVQVEAEWKEVKNLLNRNSSLVERAVHFVLGSTLKICATAFEVMSLHPLVLYRLQELLPVTTCEARGIIKASLQRLNLDFWRLSGVVKEEFVCGEAKASEVQIDQLGFDAWQAVRKFLTVADVADSSQPQL